MRRGQIIRRVCQPRLIQAIVKIAPIQAKLIRERVIKAGHPLVVGLLDPGGVERNARRIRRHGNTIEHIQRHGIKAIHWNLISLKRRARVGIDKLLADG